MTNPPSSMWYETQNDDEKRILTQYKVAKVDERTNKLRNSVRGSALFIERYYNLLKPGGKVLTIVDESIIAPEVYMQNNAMGTIALLEQARRNGYKGKIIFASSAEIYGTAVKEMMDEDHPIDPLSPYAVAKLAAEQMCKLYAQLHGLDITVIRNFNTFGEYQSGGMYGGVIAKFKSQAVKGEEITVYVS